MVGFFPGCKNPLLYRTFFRFPKQVRRENGKGFEGSLKTSESLDNS